MRTIGRTELEHARGYIEAHGRPLEQALFEHHFVGANADRVREKLAAFHNPDGGFGRGLEPDFWLPDSSPMATSIGLGILLQIETAADHPLVQTSVQYLVETYEPQRMGWQSVPPAVNHYPHAPWWHDQSAAKEAEPPLHYGPNPSAELAGYLAAYASAVKGDLAAALAAHMSDRLLAHGSEMEMHDLYCYLRFAALLPAERAAALRPKLSALVGAAVSTDPAEWGGYTAQPLDFVDSPDSFLHDGLQQPVAANLDYWLSTMTADCVWTPNWEWGSYEDEWLEAREAIIGMLTVRRLRILDAFGRVESGRQ